LCNPEVDYKFKKRLPNYVIQNVTERYFWKYENLWGKRKIYGGAGRNSPLLKTEEQPKFNWVG